MSSSSSPVKVVPFVEQEDTVVNLRQVIYNLRHQISNLKTENALLNQTNKSVGEKYETIITDKNATIQKLQDDFSFVFKEREALKSLGTNTKQVTDKKAVELQKQNASLTEQNSQLKRQLDEVDDSVYRINSKYQKCKSDLDYTVEVNEQLEDRLSNLEDDNSQLLKSNDDLIKKLEEFGKSASSGVNQFNETLHLTNISLQKTNNQLRLKLDKLLQNKTSNELLKSKNDSLMKKCQDLDSLREKYAKLEIEKIELENRYTQFVKFLDASGEQMSETSMSKFIASYNNLKNVNLILEEKYDTCQREVNEYKSSIIEFEHQLYNELQPTIDNLTANSAAKDDIIDKLKSQVNLSKKEIDFLRSSLTKMERVVNQNQKEAVQKSTDEYLSNLERLVDEYKKEISSLQSQLQAQKQAQPAEFSIESGSKRPRIDDVYRKKSELENSTIQNENVKLQAKIKELTTQIDVLQTQIDNYTTIDVKKKQLHVLQMKSNPFTKDQIVKQETLNALKTENEQLLTKFVESNPTVDVPRAVFERQEMEKDQLQSKINDLHKMNLRLSERFTRKARDILFSISKFFGFTIEFLESTINSNELGTKIKLISKYNDDELKNAYLILDLPTETIKAYGNNQFKSFCSDLMNEWVSRDQASCVLSALNIKLYQKYVLREAQREGIEA